MTTDLFTFGGAANFLEGNVGIGTSLYNAGSVGTAFNSSSGGARAGLSSGDVWELNRIDVDGTIFSFKRNSVIVGSIAVDTVQTHYVTTSDRRIKENIDSTKIGLDDLMKLPVREFSFTADDSGAMTTGFIAQELFEVFPWAVTTNGDNGIDPLTGSSSPWGVDYGRVTPLIVKSVQELNIKLEELATTTPFAELEADSFAKRFFKKLSAWFADASNGIDTIVASVFNASEMICVDGECLTASDIRELKALSGKTDIQTDPHDSQSEDTTENDGLDHEQDESTNSEATASSTADVVLDDTQIIDEDNEEMDSPELEPEVPTIPEAGKEEPVEEPF